MLDTTDANHQPGGAWTTAINALPATPTWAEILALSNALGIDTSYPGAYDWPIIDGESADMVWIRPPAAPGPSISMPVTTCEGSVYVNTADKKSWVFDGGTWVELGSAPAAAAGGPTVTTDATTGHTPTTNPPAGAKSGDVFINTTDGQTWIHDGTAWQPITTRHPLTYFGNAGAGAPSAAVVPTGTGDLYLDKTAAAAGGASIYEADAAGRAWQAAASITMLSGDQFFDIPNTDVYREV